MRLVHAWPHFARIRLARLNFGRERTSPVLGQIVVEVIRTILLLLSLRYPSVFRTSRAPFRGPSRRLGSEREANKHRRYITRRPQIPSGPLNGPNEAAGQRSTWPNSSSNERARRVKGRERGLTILSGVFEHPERPRATVSKGP